MAIKKCFDCKIEIAGGILCKCCEEVRKKEFDRDPKRFGDMSITVRPKIRNRKIIRRKKRKNKKLA